MVDRDPSDIKELQKIFHADWEELTYVPKDPDLVVSPNNSRARILKLIDSAKKSLMVQCEFVSDPEIAQHLGARAKAGVDVKVMMAHFDKDPNTGRDSNADSQALLNGQGVNQLLFNKSIKMHAKMILADNARAYIGSENMTSNSLDNNREMGVLVEDKAIIETLAKTAAKDWAAR
ncbi:Cardiolipin synthase [compost metagenome]